MEKIERRGRRPKYPWPFWTNGQVHTVRQGTDFQTSAATFVTMLHGHASSRQPKLKCSTVTSLVDGLFAQVTFQFRPVDDPSPDKLMPPPPPNARTAAV